MPLQERSAETYRVPLNTNAARTLGSLSIAEPPSRVAHLVISRDGIFSLSMSEITRLQPNITQRFRELRDRWLRETRFISSDSEIVLNEAYQQIIGLGPAVLPVIFQELTNKLGLWFWALKSITGEDPVAPEDIGAVRRMADAWLRWGAERGYV